MGIVRVDPCQDLEEVTEDPVEGTGGQDVPPEGEPVAPAPAITPVPQSEEAIQLNNTWRMVRMIDQQNYFSSNISPPADRFPGLHPDYVTKNYLSENIESFRKLLTIPGGSSTLALVDSFRVVSGLIYNFRMGKLRYPINPSNIIKHSGNRPSVGDMPIITTINPSVPTTPGLTDSWVEGTVPYKIEGLEDMIVTPREGLPRPLMPSSISSFLIGFNRLIWNSFYASLFRSPVNGRILLNEEVQQWIDEIEEFIFGEFRGKFDVFNKMATPTYEVLDENDQNQYRDFSFQAPAAYHKKEIEEIGTTLRNFVEISSTTRSFRNRELTKEQIERAQELGPDGEIGTPDDGTIEAGEIPLPSSVSNLRDRTRQLENQEYQIEYGENSLYRNSRWGVNRDLGDIIQNSPEPCPTDEIQKFPSETLDILLKVNNLATAQESDLGLDSDRETREIRLAEIEKARQAMQNHVSIDFVFTNPSSGPFSTREIARIIRDNGYDSYLLDTLSSKYKNQKEPGSNPLFAQIIDQIGFDMSEVSDQAPGQFVSEEDRLDMVTSGLIQEINVPEGLNDRVSIGYEPQYYEGVISALITKAAWGSDINSKDYPLGHNYPPPGPEANADFFDELADFLEDKRRTYEGILQQKFCYSEVVAYRIEKKSIQTGKVLQNFYLFNSPGVQNFKFIDTQVIPYKDYLYTIYTINAVSGANYAYSSPFQESNYAPEDSDLSVFEQLILGIAGVLPDAAQYPEGSHYRVFAGFNPQLNFIEAPYYRQAVILSDAPPLPPDVTFIPYVGVDNRFTLSFQEQLGEIYDQPIALLDSDISLINRMRQSQNIIDGGDIHYKSDSPPLKYQIMFLEEQPESYRDFSRGIIYNTGWLEPYFNVNIDPNKDYYMTARAIDRAGASNPTSVFRVRIDSRGDGISPIFEPYEIRNRPPAVEVSLERGIKISPATVQKNINFSELDVSPDDEEFYRTAPRLSRITLGSIDEDKRIWGKKYKFRVKSKRSLKCVDFNVKFGFSKIENIPYTPPENETSAGQEAASYGYQPAQQTLNQDDAYGAAQVTQADRVMREYCSDPMEPTQQSEAAQSETAETTTEPTAEQTKRDAMGEQSVQDSLDTNIERNTDPRDLVMDTETESDWHQEASTQSEEYYEEAMSTDSDQGFKDVTQTDSRPTNEVEQYRTTTTQSTQKEVNEKLVQELLEEQETVDSMVKNNNSSGYKDSRPPNTETQEKMGDTIQTTTNQSKQINFVGKMEDQDGIMEGTEIELRKAGAVNAASNKGLYG